MAAVTAVAAMTVGVMLSVAELCELAAFVLASVPAVTVVDVMVTVVS